MSTLRACIFPQSFFAASFRHAALARNPTGYAGESLTARKQYIGPSATNRVSVLAGGSRHSSRAIRRFVAAHTGFLS